MARPASSDQATVRRVGRTAARTTAQPSDSAPCAAQRGGQQPRRPLLARQQQRAGGERGLERVGAGEHRVRRRGRAAQHRGGGAGDRGIGEHVPTDTRAHR